MTMWMLDTNIVSAAIRQKSAALDKRLKEAVAGSGLCVSAVTFGEARYGAAFAPERTHLVESLDAFFLELQIMPWTAATATVYGHLRADMRHSGFALQPLDMLIAAHALEAGATLVTSDRAFLHVPGLVVEDWTAR